MTRDTTPEAMARALLESEGVEDLWHPACSFPSKEVARLIALAIRRERAACIRANASQHAHKEWNFPGGERDRQRYNQGVGVATAAIRARNRRKKP